MKQKRSKARRLQPAASERNDSRRRSRVQALAEKIADLHQISAERHAAMDKRLKIIEQALLEIQIGLLMEQEPTLADARTRPH